MADWNELFHNESNVERVPEADVIKFGFQVKCRNQSDQQSLSIWDLGCGGGRHTIALAKLGFNVYSSDNAPKAIELTKEWLKELDLKGHAEIAEMDTCPWNRKFDAIISWNVINHNTRDKIIDTIQVIHDHLKPKGLFLATLKSTKADLYGTGQEIEPNTFIMSENKESGVPHHYFTEKEIRTLFPKEKWNYLAFVEEVVNQLETPDGFWKYTPFRFTNFIVFLQRKD